MRTMHLFAGAAGGLYADLILGHQPVCAVEWDPYCCAVLRERAADGWFPGLHVHEGDVRLFDPSPWKGRVDCVAAGFPCQPFSEAGKQLGAADERNGWPEVVRVLRILRPRYVLLENVSGLVSNGYLAVILGDLAALGYDARWTIVSAAEVGAPHIRERWICLATHPDALRGGREGDSQRDSQQERPKQQAPLGDNADGLHPYVADPDRERGQGRRPLRERDADAGQRGAAVADASVTRLHDGSHTGVRGTEGGRGPWHGEPERSGWWSAEPDVGRMAHGVAARKHRVQALGNGQVPLQIAAAWRLLGGP